MIGLKYYLQIFETKLYLLKYNLHTYLRINNLNAIVTELWLKEVSCVATLTIHDTEPLP